MDEGKLGRPPKTPEFPSLTQEDMKEVLRIFAELAGEKFQDVIWGTEEYTGTGQDVGRGDIFYNSRLTRSQLLYAMAMTRHPLIKELIKPEFDATKFNAKVLVDNKIMVGMKILDLGSGPEPVFARCCRAMGADVWTVDKKPEFRGLDFRNNRDLLPGDQRELEDARHIEIDLSHTMAPKVILERSGGDFNLITEANLGIYVLEEKKVLSLLKKGGVFHNTSWDPTKPILKE